MIMRLRLTLAGSLIGGFMIWACGGEETTTSPGGQQQQVATQLAFTVEPTTTIVASSIMPAVQVAIQDALGNLVAGATDAVTVAIGTNPGGGALSGTTTVNAVAGVASFTDLTIDQAGTGYTLMVSSGSLSTATSAAFHVLDFIVNSADDIDDAMCDATHCSFREALNAANANPGSDLIGFDIPGSGPHTIQPNSALPTITDPVVIDGTTEPDFAGTPIIELDGTNAGDVNGLVITAGNSTVRGLVINRFGSTLAANGILLQTNGGNVIEGNFIGTDVTGTAVLPNTGVAGVFVSNVPNNTIGGTTAEARNVISGNGDGVFIQFSGATGNLVQGNYIGTDVTGTVALGNRGQGVFIEAPNNTIGGTIAGARNLISGNTENGVFITDPGATGNLVQGNFIGTDVTGTAVLSNSGVAGVVVENAPNNTIGGTTAEARNVISGNGDGVFISGSGATGNLVQGNYIGTDVTGTVALGNRGQGVHVGSALNNMIGGTTGGARNVISGNIESGVLIADPGTTGNLVQGNYIGIDATGTVALSNGGSGVILLAAGNTVGGTTDGARNVISGNDINGVAIGGSGATGNVVQGNYIGTDVTGTSDLGNAEHGVDINTSASNNVIGGTTVGARNVISGNTFNAVNIHLGASLNFVQGNYIGADVTGTVALGNGGDGVLISEGNNNTIGGTTIGAGNTIAFNGGSGALVQSGTGNSIVSNSIFSNTGLGIDLNDDGVTLNDAGDGDTGANDLQNFPVLTSAASAGGSITIAGDLNSTATTDFRLEFFANAVCDPSGNGEGETLLGSTMVTTDGSGNASFMVTFTATVAVGQFITATATDPNNNTSEFSQCTTVT